MTKLVAVKGTKTKVWGLTNTDKDARDHGRIHYLFTDNGVGAYTCYDIEDASHYKLNSVDRPERNESGFVEHKHVACDSCNATFVNRQVDSVDFQVTAKEARDMVVEGTKVTHYIVLEQHIRSKNRSNRMMEIMMFGPMAAGCREEYYGPGSEGVSPHYHHFTIKGYEPEDTFQKKVEEIMEYRLKVDGCCDNFFVIEVDPEKAMTFRAEVIGINADDHEEVKFGPLRYFD